LAGEPTIPHRPRLSTFLPFPAKMLPMTRPPSGVITRPPTIEGTCVTTKTAPVILIVEENPNVLDDLIACVRELDWNIELAAQGATARRQIERSAPRLVILSRELRDEDGVALTAELATSAATRDLPVLLLSDRAAPEDIAEGLAAGAVDYITKPFKKVELQARLRRQLAANDRLREALSGSEG